MFEDKDAPTFYAVFFEDPLGNRLEVCHHRMDKIALEAAGSANVDGWDGHRCGTLYG